MIYTGQHQEAPIECIVQQIIFTASLVCQMLVVDDLNVVACSPMPKCRGLRASSRQHNPRHTLIHDTLIAIGNQAGPEAAARGLGSDDTRP